MNKFGNIFKKQPKQATLPPGQPEVETAVMLALYENGGSTVGYLNLEGVKMKRTATMNDLYRMCAETMQQIETIRITERLINVIQQASKPPVKPYAGDAPVPEKDNPITNPPQEVNSSDAPAVVEEKKADDVKV